MAAPAGDGADGREERYSLGYGAAEQGRLGRRAAAGRAAFFLPYLRPGMRLLDAGCGPGSITVDLAAVVAPGEVVGVDLEPRQIAAARTLAHERQAPGVRFAVADVYRLPFPAASFDAAFAHTVLFHLREPLRALRELRRVLRSGGVIGVRDPDAGTEVRVPATPALEQFATLVLRFAEHNGASPHYARHQRRLLLDAGFCRAEAGAVASAPAPRRRRGGWPSSAWDGFAIGPSSTPSPARAGQIRTRSIDSAARSKPGASARTPSTHTWTAPPSGGSPTEHERYGGCGRRRRRHSRDVARARRRPLH